MELIKKHNSNVSLPPRRSDPRPSRSRTKKTLSLTIPSISKLTQPIINFHSKPQTFSTMHTRLSRTTKVPLHSQLWTKHRLLTTKIILSLASKSSLKMRSPSPTWIWTIKAKASSAKQRTNINCIHLTPWKHQSPSSYMSQLSSPRKSSDNGRTTLERSGMTWVLCQEWMSPKSFSSRIYKDE